MDIIVQFAEDPDSLTPEQMQELKNELLNAVKHKISKLENKYKIKIKFPNDMCNIKNNNKLPLPTIGIQMVQPSAYIPFELMIEDFSEQNYIDGLSSCMKVVNSIKKDFESFEEGKITKSQIDSQFFDWLSDEDCIKEEEKVYGSEIEEMYDKKFGKKAIIDELIKKLESSYII